MKALKITEEPAERIPAGIERSVNRSEPDEAGGDPVQRAMAFYESELRSKLEPEYNHQYVAIDPDTHDYLVELRPGRAFRAMEARCPNGVIVVHTIGEADAGLLRRMRGESLP
jgi:hypothetical protein